MTETREKLMKRVLILNDRVWERRLSKPKIDEWLANFTGKVVEVELERLHALFWLSQFMYFGSREIRVLLKALYRDLFLCPMINDVRTRLPSGHSDDDLMRAVTAELAHTRFLGVGNPSESGVHLLYFFRQENVLAKAQFMDAAQIFERKNATMRILRKPGIRRYVFLDDICGSGDTATNYSTTILSELLLLAPNVKASYYSLFASAEGLKQVREGTLFGSASGAVYELDETYKSLSPHSRYFTTTEYPEIDRATACSIATVYGDLLDPAYSPGYKNSQLLLGFHHNTPDNTLGIIWAEDVPATGSKPWSPIFKRYPKIYGASA